MPQQFILIFNFHCKQKGDIHKTRTRISVYIVVQFYPWFKFSFLFFCFQLIIIHYHTQKQQKRKFEPRIKLNHKFSAACLSRFVLPNCEQGNFEAWELGLPYKSNGNACHLTKGWNCRFWSYLRCLGWKVTIFAHSGIAWGCAKRNLPKMPWCLF